MRETADEIEAQAVSWAWRVDAGQIDADALAEFEAWLEGDARHKGAYVQARAALSLIDPIYGVKSSTTERRISRSKVIAAAACAVLFGCVALGSALYINFIGSEHYTTQLGEIRRVPLKDGSSLAVNTKSEVSVKWSDSERDVTVRQGEAWFHVAPNKSRPFVVAVGRLRVRAVGTAFSVRLAADGAEVKVSEGVVEVWRAGDANKPIRVAAGAAAILPTEGGPIFTESSTVPSIDRELAWRDGKIDLDGETLSEAVAKFNRYNRTPITISDGELSSRRVFGLFRADDPVAFASAVRIALGTDVTISATQIEIGSTRVNSSQNIHKDLARPLVSGVRR